MDGSGGKLHVVTMSKGGVGKTVVGWTLTQFLRDAGRKVVAVDLDTQSHSLAEFKGLGVRTVDLLSGIDMALNSAAIDRLAEDIIISADSDFVLDNGVTGFIPLSRYLVENERSIWEDGFAGRLVIHAVLAGGAMSAQCLLGLDTLLETFGPAVKFVLWANEFRAPFRVQDTALQDIGLLKNNADRILGTVWLPRLPPLFAAAFDAMQEKRLTYSEAIASPNFLLLPRGRMRDIQKSVWKQLDEIGLAA